VRLFGAARACLQRGPRRPARLLRPPRHLHRGYLQHRAPPSADGLPRRRRTDSDWSPDGGQ